MQSTRPARAAGAAAVLSFVALAASVPPAHANINVSTGLDSFGNRITTGGVSDAHWRARTSGGYNFPAQTVFPGNADWGSWAANGPSSDWIAGNANSAANGAYYYETTFDLTGYVVSTVTLSGNWAIDDAGSIVLNGNTVATLPYGQTAVLNSFSAPSSFFIAGLNTLRIVQSSSDNYLDGARLEGTVSGMVGGIQVPTPAALPAGALLLAITLSQRRPRHAAT